MISRERVSEREKRGDRVFCRLSLYIHMNMYAFQRISPGCVVEGKVLHIAEDHMSLRIGAWLLNDTVLSDITTQRPLRIQDLDTLHIHVCIIKRT